MPLAEPPDPAAVSGFPGRWLIQGDVLYRIHWRTYGAFWFSSLPDGEGRYDLPSPHGACYTARSSAGAWLERFQTDTTVDLAELRQHRLARITTPVDLNLADLAASLARGFGVTGDIHVMDSDEYRLPRAWAAALHGVGWRGLEGRARHDPALGERTVTIFDGEGAHAPFDDEWRCVNREVATDWDLHDEMRQRFGYVVAMPVPQDVVTIRPRPEAES